MRHARATPVLHATEPPGDAVLVARAHAGDPAAARELVRRHLRVALAVARAILDDMADAEDACQDAFATVFEKLDRYDPAFAFRGWLLTIVRNRALGIRRRQRVRRAEVLGTGAGEVDAPASAADDPRTALERAELRARIAAAMDVLSATQREVLLLHDVEGWRHGEIAAHIGVSPVTSRTHLFKARQRLRLALGADFRAWVA
jgi:RNA polymerase sigma-70 factor, ECF subfamily